MNRGTDYLLPQKNCGYCSQMQLREARVYFSHCSWNHLHLYCQLPVSYCIARAEFQAETLILLYFNSDKPACMENIRARGKCSPVHALNPFLVLLPVLLPDFAVNPSQSGVQFFSRKDFISQRLISFNTWFSINGYTLSGIRK